MEEEGKGDDHEEAQKFYDLCYTHPTISSQGIEIFMRSLEQDPTQITHHQGNGMSISMIPSTTSATLQDLHSSIILQSLGLNATEEDESCSSSPGDRPHVCQVCRASYKTRTHLRRHMTIHLNNRPYPCPDCGKGFNRKEHLNKHIEAVHSGTKYKCHFCGKEISRKDHLSRHIKNMHPAFAANLKEGGGGDDQSVLKIQLPCGQKQKAQLSFLTPSFGPSQSSTPSQNLNNSVNTLSHSNHKSHKSRPNNNNNKSHLQQQQQNLQNQSQPSLPSQIILDQPIQPFQLQQLLAQGSTIVVPSHVTTLSVPTTSSISGVSGSVSESPQKPVNKLQNHNNTTLNTQTVNGLLGLTNLSLTLGGQIREAPFSTCSEKKIILQVFTCTECNASYTTEKDLAAHIKTHKPQNFKCTECPRAYTRREKLTEHIRCFHQGQKFKCEYCGKELSRKDHVLRHVRSIHPEVLASRFTAQMQENVCEVNLGDGTTKLVQGSGNGSSNSAALNEMGVLLRSVCHICLKVFGTSYHLSRHIESCHNGDNRPYPCSSCSKQFKRKDHLTKHLKSHCPSIRESNQNQNNQQNLHQGRKSLPNLAKIKMEGQSDERKRFKRMKIENGSIEGLLRNLSDCKNDDRILKQDDGEFNLANLAMLNSFIAENVSVVVEEGELSSLILHQQEQLQQEQQSSETISEENGEIQERNDDTATTTATHSTSQEEESLTSHNNHHQINTTYNCGYCQKEFCSRDQLVDHIQEHSNEDIITQDHNDDPGGLPHQQIHNLELASF